MVFSNEDADLHKDKVDEYCTESLDPHCSLSDTNADFCLTMHHHSDRPRVWNPTVAFVRTSTQSFAALSTSTFSNRLAHGYFPQVVLGQVILGQLSILVIGELSTTMPFLGSAHSLVGDCSSQTFVFSSIVGECAF